MKQSYRRSPSTHALMTSAVLLIAPGVSAQEARIAEVNRLPAKAGEFSLKVEPGLAIPLTAPQSELFELGGGQTVKAFWALNEHWDIGPSATFLALPTDTSSNESGTAWSLGGSVRFKRTHSAPDNDKYHAISPWVDADALYVATGELSRPGFALAAGFAVPLGERRTFWLGPFVRYLHILQGARTGFDNHDAKILSVGLSLEVGAGVEREYPEERLSEQAVTQVRTNDSVTLFCPDRDNDSVPDNVDHCVEVVGPMDNWGCPVYEKLVVKQDKLELKEKLYFAWDQAIIQDVSFPVLDEVVRALKDNKNFRVQVEGHTSSEGLDDHNQTLSEQRAQAVLDYLASHGVDKERLSSKGFSSAIPLDTNETVEGRENNRRVEFVVHFTILNKGTN